MAAQIKFNGPLSVAHYMRRSLNHPTHGYYSQQTVFGTDGDFVTSPEISQLFGEMVGVWFMTNWIAANRPSRVQIVELGPGRGTLLADMLRALQAFRMFGTSLSRIVLIEASPKLREEQLRAVMSAFPGTSVDRESRNDFKHLDRAVLSNQLEVLWYEHLQDMEHDDHTFLIAHEFFDALPVYKFKKTEAGWREILVDIDEASDGHGRPVPPHHFRYALAPQKTPTVSAMLESTKRYENCVEGDVVEICPEATGYIQRIADVVGSTKGSALVMDYGNDYASPASLRAIRKHQFVSVFESPGMCDLTADVDFSLLRWALEPYARGNTDGHPPVRVYGPTTQRHFLARMGIEDRARMLLRAAPDAEAKMALRTGLTRLMSKKEMGTVYKMLAIVADDDVESSTSSGKPKQPPAAFEAADFPTPMDRPST
ncbi:S-adenosyl-L-methionine-dependent methyltransferase [Blastocladiella britannica]|nr:S-adenosyl-L-methionine-dependent methyltransferase [Blastocladiella britannica]